MDKIPVLNQNREFRRVYTKGNAYVDGILVTYVLKNRNGQVRYGITTSKKIGCAVERNRARRIIREAVRQTLPCLSCGADLVFVARTRTVQMKSVDLVRVLRRQMKKAGLL